LLLLISQYKLRITQLEDSNSELSSILLTRTKDMGIMRELMEHLRVCLRVMMWHW
jgi:hypothetical protein